MRHHSQSAEKKTTTKIKDQMLDVVTVVNDGDDDAGTEGVILAVLSQVLKAFG